jgi:hypothetical protein
MNRDYFICSFDIYGEEFLCFINYLDCIIGIVYISAPLKRHE